MTEFTLGYDSYKKSTGTLVPLKWDLSRLANPHTGISGTSGSGKTYQIRRFINAFSKDPEVRITILDYHGDIDVEGACEVLFSESTRYGYNPFIVNPDQHYGGLRKSANHIIEIMSSNRKLGEQQNAVLRQLIMDCYALKGMYQDRPHTWVKRNASEDECQKLFNERNWNELRLCYPTLTDLERLITRKLKYGLFGLDDHNKSNVSLRAFETFMRSARSLDKTKAKDRKESTEKSREALDKQRQTAIQEYEAALNAVETGNELDELMKYDSVDTLRSLGMRLENVKALGLFNANEPPFSGQIHRYNLKPLVSSQDELKMFVYSRMLHIYREALQKGESHGKIREVIVLDEAKKFCDEEDTNPINIIALEARKFGVALVLASQSPAHFSKDFISTAGTLLVQNMSPTEWVAAATKLQIEKKKLEYLKPRETALLKMQLIGQPMRWNQIDYAG